MLIKCVISVLVCVFGLLLIEFSVVQIAYPVSSIIETRGIVVGTLKETRNHPVDCYQTRFTTSTGEVFEIGFLDNDNNIQINDVVPVVYYPWDPVNAQIGSLDRLSLVAPSIQQIFILISGVLGASLTIVSINFAVLCTKSTSMQRIKPIIRLSAFLAISILLFALLYLAWMSYIPALTTEFGC